MKIKLLPYQYEFLKCEQKFALLRGGVGAGKTYTICLWAIKRMTEHPGSMGLILANSYSQLSRATLTTMFRILDEWGIKYKFNKLQQVLYLENGSKAKAHSLESYDDLRGIEASWAIVDELAFASLQAWNVLIGRIRLKNYGPLQVRCGSTPNGFNFMYDMFAGPSKTSFHAEVYADTTQNYHLPDGYLESLRASYDPLTYKQEVMGQYVASTSGRKYYAFDRDKNVVAFDHTRFVNAGLEASAGFDFNVNPATAAIGWLINGTYYIVDEVFQENSNTFNQAKAVADSPYGVSLGYPDGAGSSRNSSSTQTDHEILEQHGFDLRFSRRNPPIKDRVNTANWLFAQKKVIIHPRCKNLIRDFEEEVWEKNPSDVGHIADAATYWFFYETPCQAAREQPQLIQW